MLMPYIETGGRKVTKVCLKRQVRKHSLWVKKWQWRQGTGWVAKICNCYSPDDIFYGDERKLIYQLTPGKYT